MSLIYRLRDAGVWLAPGESCGSDTPGYYRLCFAQVSDAELEIAVERLIKAFSVTAKL